MRDGKGKGSVRKSTTPSRQTERSARSQSTTGRSKETASRGKSSAEKRGRGRGADRLAPTTATLRNPRGRKSGTRAGEKLPRNSPKATRPNSDTKTTRQQPTERKPQWVYWVRRVIALMVLLALVVGLVFLGIWVTQKAQALLAGSKEAKPADTNAVINCPPEDLQISLRAPGGQIHAAQGASFQLDIKNTGSHPCIIEGNAKNLGVKITSGDEVVFLSTSCAAANTPARKLLFSPQTPWTTAIAWDGKVSGSGCKGTEPAASGTYVIAPVRGTAVVGDERVFNLVGGGSATPTPTETSPAPSGSPTSPTSETPSPGTQTTKPTSTASPKPSAAN